MPNKILIRLGIPMLKAFFGGDKTKINIELLWHYRFGSISFILKNLFIVEYSFKNELN